ncbi:MAG: glutamate ligase domain-containing protein, partial [Acutalibacteraceae bacterium]
VSQPKPVSHRLELKPFINGSILIDDAYNANPVGSKEAINVLASFDGMTKICVTPGLIELGDKEYDENKTLGRHMADKCDKIFLIGEQRSKPIEEGIRSVKSDADVTVFKSFADALSELKRICNRNTVVIFENDLPDNYLK